MIDMFSLHNPLFSQIGFALSPNDYLLIELTWLNCMHI